MLLLLLLLQSCAAAAPSRSLSLSYYFMRPANDKHVKINSNDFITLATCIIHRAPTLWRQLSTRSTAN
jgi:hypothetical protein